jgi:hypothetical protein
VGARRSGLRTNRSHQGAPRRSSEIAFSNRLRFGSRFQRRVHCQRNQAAQKLSLLRFAGILLLASMGIAYWISLSIVIERWRTDRFDRCHAF